MSIILNFLKLNKILKLSSLCCNHLSFMFGAKPGGAPALIPGIPIPGIPGIAYPFFILASCSAFGFLTVSSIDRIKQAA